MTAQSSAVAPAVRLIEPEQAPLLVRQAFAGGRPSPITASLAHVPELLEVTLPFVGTVLGPSAIAGRTKEIAIVRASALLRCRYCVETHSAIALDCGLSRDEVLALREASVPEGLFSDPAELALIDWIDAVVLGRGPVPAAPRRRLQDLFAEPDVVELTLVVAATMMLNRYCTALDLPTSPATLSRLASEGIA
jgi:AhpD family alkylhydroperoxidase